MNKTLTLFFALTILLPACREESEAPSPRTAESALADEESEVDRAKTKEKVEKKHAIRFFKDAFQPSPEPEWVRTVRKSAGSPLCSLREEFQRMETAWKYLGDVIAWDDLDVDEEAVREMYRETALDFARELYRLFDVTYSRRQELGNCGSGEGRLEFTDGGKMMQELIAALTAAHGTPEDVETTAEDLRLWLKDDFKFRLHRLREEAGASKSFLDELQDMLPFVETPESVAARRFRTAALQALDEWDFTPLQIGLTEKEVRDLRKESAKPVPP